jgi:hypothetical protein
MSRARHQNARSARLAPLVHQRGITIMEKIGDDGEIDVDVRSNMNLRDTEEYLLAALGAVEREKAKAKLTLAANV